MACETLPAVNYNASSGAYVQLSTAANGEIPIYFYHNTSAFIVGPADNLTAANALESAGRSMVLVSQMHAMILDPSKFWIKSTSASGGTLYITRQH